MYEELVKELRASEEYGGEDAYMIGQAADAIDELDTLLDGARANNDALCETIERLKKQVFDMSSLIGYYSEKTRWVPVTERVPDERDFYLAVTEDCEIWVCEFIPSVNQWWIVPSDDWVQNVTHWQPLPEPPKEET